MRTLNQLVVVLVLTAANSGCLLEEEEADDSDSTGEVQQAAEGPSWTRPGFFSSDSNPYLRRGYYHPMSWYGGVPGTTTGHRNRAGEACSYYVGVHKLGRLVLDCPTNNYTSCSSVCVPRSGTLYTPSFVTPTWSSDRLDPRATNPFLKPHFVHIMSYFPTWFSSASRVGEKCTVENDAGAHVLGTLVYDCLGDTEADYDTCVGFCRAD
jgi:hypothetical protein